jgi:hypothetical protein
MNLRNLKSFDDYLVEGLDDFEINENDVEFESDGENDVYLDGELYEATAPRLTSKERQKAQEIGRLMTALNKKQSYITAKEKFIKVFKVEAKKTVQELKLNPKVLKKLDKITLRSI